MSEQNRILDDTALIAEIDSDISWVSPEVSDAQDGKQVEMGQTIADS